MLRSILLATCFVVSTFGIATTATACGCKDKKEAVAVEKTCGCKKEAVACDCKK